MSVREYIGARYVPLFMGDWDNTKTYEPLSIVQNEGNSYTSRQYVPTGIDITNDTYWAETGNYNAQVEAYREEVQNYANSVSGVIADVDAIESTLDVKPYAFDSETEMVAYADLKAGDICHICNKDNDPKQTWWEISETASETKTSITLENGLFAIEYDVAEDFAPAYTDDMEKRFHMIPYPDYSYDSLNDEYVLNRRMNAKSRVAYVEDNTLKYALFNAGMNFVADGHYDLANAITLMNTYLVEQEKFKYGIAYLGGMYTGQYDDPYPVNPKANPDYALTSRMDIDCATFATLIGNGVTFANSTYARAENTNADHFQNKTGNVPYHPMYNEIADNVKPYWFYSSAQNSSTLLTRECGLGRLGPTALSKMLYDSGNLNFIGNPAVGLIPGTLNFYGITNPPVHAQTPVIYDPGHCYFIGGFIGASETTDYIIVDSTSGSDISADTGDWGTYGGVCTRKMESKYASNTFAYYQPPFISGTKLQISGTTYNYCKEFTTALNGDGFEWQPGVDDGASTLADKFLGARVVAITTNNIGAYQFTITLTNTFFKNAVTPQTMSKNVTLRGGVYVFYFPYGWDMKLTSSSSTQVNIALNITSSDKYIRIPARTS